MSMHMYSNASILRTNTYLGLVDHEHGLKKIAFVTLIKHLEVRKRLLFTILSIKLLNLDIMAILLWTAIIKQINFTTSACLQNTKHSTVEHNNIIIP